MFRHIFLLSQWIGLHHDLNYLGFKNIGKILREYMRIVKLYGMGDRFYHTLEHIANTLKLVNGQWPQAKTARFASLIKLALFYHDCIYDVKSKTNEEDSADEFMLYAKEMNFPSWLTDQVQELIILTKSHKLSESAPLMHKVMNDADMSIFIAPLDVYRRYAANIAREYKVFGRDAYLQGRLAFLSSVDPDTIFHTNELKRFVELVKSNIRYERTILLSNPDSLLD